MMKKREARTIDNIEFLVALKAISYIRVSTDDQKDYGTSPDKQRKVNAEYASAHGIEIIETIEDDYSGRKLNRPGFDQVRTYLNLGLANCLIVYSADRLSRHRTHTLMIIDELQELGCELHLATKGRVDLADDTQVLMLSIEGHLAHKEVNDITERLKNGRLEKTDSGQIMVSSAPYGFQIRKEIEETPHGRIIVVDRQLELHPIESVMAKMIFKLYASGEYSFNSLAKHLNEQGYTWRNGQKWNQQHIRRILKNRVYIGEYQYGGIAVEVLEIINPDLWDAVQTRIGENQKKRRRRNRYNYLFSRRVTCWHCRNAMSGYSKGKGKPKSYRCGAAYRPIAYFYKTTCHNSLYYREADIQKVVFTWLEQVLTDPKTLRKGWEDFVAKQMENHRPILDELRRVEKIITVSERKLNKLLDAYLDEVIDKETYQHRKQHLDQEIEGAKLVKADLETKLTDLDKLPQQLKTIEELELIAEKAFAHGIPPSYQPRLIKDLDVRIELEFADGERWAHITCIVGNTEQAQLISSSVLIGV